jgi:GntR family transcriptional regulator
MERQLVKDPMYKQLNGVLRGMIRDGKIKPGGQFPTEREISERFGVSRITANKALSNLVSEGVLEFRKGVGTFVRGGVLDYDLRSLVSFTQKAIAAGKTPSTVLTEFQELTGRAAGAEAVDALRVRRDEKLYYMERVRLADRIPVIVERRHVVAGFCPGLKASALRGSLYEIWTDQYKLDIAGADQSIRAVRVSGRDARLLKVRPGAAGLLVTSTGYLSGGVPLWWERTLYRGDAYEFRNRLGPLLTAHPAAGALIDLKGTVR